MRIVRFWGLAAIFALVTGAALAERSFAQAMVEITAADLTSDTTGDNRMTAQQKVNKKIADATLTGGSVVTFPSGEFKDVGEIQVFSKSGTASSGSGDTAVEAKYITFRGDGTVFTGKIMINVFNSKYVVVEDFTFRDTQTPDRVTLASGGGITYNNIDATAHRLEDTGVVWLNTAAVGDSVTCGAAKPLDNVIVRDNVFMNTARHGILARAKRSIDSMGIGNDLGSIEPADNYERCDSSAVTVSGNRFVGIGLGPNAAYLDSAKTVPGYRNRESAIEGDETYGWTVTDNVIGVTADGEDAKGTTANGIRLEEAFGKTVVSNNTVNNTAWSGIVVGGDGSSGTADVADADEAEITIANNRVTNSRNDPYIVSIWDSVIEGYDSGQWRFGTGSRGRESVYPVNGKRTLDGLLKARIHKLPSHFTLPFLGEEEDASRLVTSIVTYTPAGARPAGVGVFDSADQSGVKIPNDAHVRYLRTGLEAGLELNRLTAKTITVENNELTDNVVGLAVCPSVYCYADNPFPSIAPTYLAPPHLAPPTAGTLKVPTVRNNSIYDNDKETDMPMRFVRANVVNALTGTNTGTGNNVLVLAGNYLGINPDGVEGAVNTDDLASAVPESAGPKETDDPGLAATGGAAFSGTTITLTYDEALDGDSVPAAAAFTVTQTDGGGLSGPITVSGVSVSGTSVTLTLARAPGSGNSVTVSYDPSKAGSGTGRGPIRDVAGNEAPALTSRAVTATAPTQPPEPVEPMEPMAKTDDGGCALASGGSGGADLGALLPLVLAMFVFRRPGRNARKKS